MHELDGSGGERESDVWHRALGTCVCIHVGELLNKREPLEGGVLRPA